MELWRSLPGVCSRRGGRPRALSAQVRLGALVALVTVCCLGVSGCEDRSPRSTADGGGVSADVGGEPTGDVLDSICPRDADSAASDAAGDAVSGDVGAPRDVFDEAEGHCPAGFVYVEEATFPMGISAETDPNGDWTLFDVHVPAYCMGRTEVTASQYAEFMNWLRDERGCDGYCLCYEPLEPEACGGPLPPIDLVGGVWVPAERCQAVPNGPADSWCGDHPVTMVLWNGARAYCAWVGGRLPSEAEWERAAKGTEHRRFVWGDEPAQPGWANCNERDCADGFREAAPVGSFEMDRSVVGALDMMGNVSEWVEDDFHLSQDGAPTDGSAWIDEPRAESVVGKGGHWFVFAERLDIGGRSSAAPAVSDERWGFRCAADPDRPQ